MSDAGLVPLLGLAEQTRLPQIIADKVSIKTSRIKSGAANPAPKLMGVIAGMCAGADSIDDLDVLRAGGMPILFDGVYATWRASQIPDTGPNKVRPGTEDDLCENGVESSRLSSRTRP